MIFSLATSRDKIEVANFEVNDNLRKIIELNIFVNEIFIFYMFELFVPGAVNV